MEILIDRSNRLLRAAVLRSGTFTDLYVDRTDRPLLAGTVFVGRITRHLAGMNACMVDLGGGLTGFLNGADAAAGNRPPGPLGNRLPSGAPVLVQVKADTGGAKAPTLTTDVVLLGRHLVFRPAGRGILVSRRIAKGERRPALIDRLQPLVDNEGGWIARSTAEAADPMVLATEATALTHAWRTVRDTSADHAAPAPLSRGPNAVERALIDWGGHGPDRIVLDDKALSVKTTKWCDRFAPDLTPRLSTHAGPPTLFETYGVEDWFASLLVPQVPLPGGGSLVIEPTEALTAVDVNGVPRGHVAAINQAAACVLARHLRLRNISGMIVVDFLRMRRARDLNQLVELLRRLAADDAVQTEIYGVTKLGLVEMTRARRGAALSELIDGHGCQEEMQN